MIWTIILIIACTLFLGGIAGFIGKCHDERKVEDAKRKSANEARKALEDLIEADKNGKVTLFKKEKDFIDDSEIAMIAIKTQDGALQAYLYLSLFRDGVNFRIEVEKNESLHDEVLHYIILQSCASAKIRMMKHLRHLNNQGLRDFLKEVRSSLRYNPWSLPCEAAKLKCIEKILLLEFEKRSIGVHRDERADITKFI